MLDQPVVVRVRVLVGALEWIASDVEDLRYPKLQEWFGPHFKCLVALLVEIDTFTRHPVDVWGGVSDAAAIVVADVVPDDVVRPTI